MNMEQKAQYELPEIVELGDARELTLGQVALPKPDACDCSKSC
jgi:hypothetical protein